MFLNLKRTHMPLASIRQYVAWVVEGEQTTELRLHMMLKHRQAVLHEIEEMHDALDGINIKIERYEKRVDRWKSKDTDSGISTSNDDYIPRKEVRL